MATRVFRTRRGRITLTDDALIYDQTRGTARHERVLRVDIVGVHLITHAHMFAPIWVEVVVLLHDGALSIPHVGPRTARRVQTALGF
jgi:hypothetical protein